MTLRLPMILYDLTYYNLPSLTHSKSLHASASPSLFLGLHSDTCSLALSTDSYVWTLP